MDRFAKVENDERGEKSVEELVIEAFSRCSNYPKERAGVLGLAQGLRKASDKYRISVEGIVERCAENSPYCPTDAELFSTALSMRDELDRALKEANEKKEKREWEAQYGKPKPWEADLCLRCGAHPRSSICGPECHEEHLENCATLPVNSIFRKWPRVAASPKVRRPQEPLEEGRRA
jgi:hypothetical protein